MKAWVFPAASISLIFAPLSVISSYNCKNLYPDNRRCSDPVEGQGPQAPYPVCLVQRFSVSAFIQCADASDAPQYECGSQPLSVLNLLVRALDTEDCRKCPMVGNIRAAADEHETSGTSFKQDFCDRNPSDAGICCLGKCVDGVMSEHSIETFCGSDSIPLTDALPVVGSECTSNKDPNDDTVVDSTGADSCYDDGDDIINFSSSGGSSDDTPDTKSSASTLRPAVLTPSPSTSSQVTPNAGGALAPRVSSGAHGGKLLVAVLPILAAL